MPAEARARIFGNVAKATTIPVFVQRLTRFFAAASHGDEAMHTDARYRDTLGTDSTPDAASSARIAPEISAQPPKIIAASLNL